jgi:hypothetical protein
MEKCGIIGRFKLEILPSTIKMDVWNMATSGKAEALKPQKVAVAALKSGNRVVVYPACCGAFCLLHKFSFFDVP